MIVAVTAKAQTPAPAAQASGKEYALAHGSSFDAGVAQQLEVKPEQFVVTTISVDYPPLAIINGKSYGVGDQIPVTADKREFVTVRQILDGVVVLDYRGHQLRATTAAAGITRKAK